MDLDPNKLSAALIVQKGLQQFDVLHGPKESDGRLCCITCEVDFPCERMLLFMMLQGIASVTAMIPSGNMASVLKRFTG